MTRNLIQRVAAIAAGTAHPFALATAWVLALFASSGTPIWALWRPLGLAELTVALVLTLWILAVRHLHVAALAASVTVLAFCAIWVLALPLASVGAWWLLINLNRRRQHRPRLSTQIFTTVSVNLGVASIVLVALVVVQTSASGGFWAAAPKKMAAAPSNGPNIYVVLLDGYPRADTLLSTFGFDNTTFLNALSRLDFHVASDSRSNYSMTWVTLASMFSMTYVRDIPQLSGVSSIGPEQYRALGRAMNQSRAIEALRDAGYRIVSSASPYSDIALTNADEFYENPGPTRFEESLLEGSLAFGLAGDVGRNLFADLHRGETRSALSRLPAVAQSATQPTFMFDHVFSPHPPFVFKADGGLRPLPACFPGDCSIHNPNPEELGMSPAEYREALVDQVSYLNTLVLSTVNRLIEVDPSATIVLFSDHGTRHDLIGDTSEATRNFFAARVPGVVNLFPDNVATVNIFPTLLDATIGATFPLQKFESWISLDNRPLELHPQPCLADC